MFQPRHRVELEMEGGGELSLRPPPCRFDTAGLQPFRARLLRSEFREAMLAGINLSPR
jgi:hypothetical protein